MCGVSTGINNTSDIVIWHRAHVQQNECAHFWWCCATSEWVSQRPMTHPRKIFGGVSGVKILVWGKWRPLGKEQALTPNFCRDYDFTISEWVPVDKNDKTKYWLSSGNFCKWVHSEYCVAWRRLWVVYSLLKFFCKFLQKYVGFYFLECLWVVFTMENDYFIHVFSRFWLKV